MSLIISDVHRIFVAIMMLKKLFITLFAILYLGISSGVTLHFQYCMGKLMQVTLAHKQVKKCDTCGMKSGVTLTKACCSDSHKELKADKSLSVTYTQILQVLDAGIPVREFSWPSADEYTPLDVTFPSGQSPPLTHSIPVFLRNCNFRI